MEGQKNVSKFTIWENSTICRIFKKVANFKGYLDLKFQFLGKIFGRCACYNIIFNFGEKTP